jgi:membrane-bound ClpP family serine protease
MSLLVIIMIIAVGIIFIFVEFFFIPGFSVFSILGGLVAGIGIYLGYVHYGQATGNWILTASVVAAGAVLYWGYKRLQSKKWALKTEIDSRVNNENYSAYKIGDIGKTITNLRPEGKALFANDERITVYSISDFIDKNVSVQIIKIEHQKIFVKPVNQ